MTKLKQLNIRNKFYLELVEELSEKLEMPPMDVVKTAIARMHNEYFCN